MSPSLVEVAHDVVKTLHDHGYLAYFAGGWVRDFILGLPPGDIDIATDAPLTTLQNLFPKTIPVGAAFGSLVVREKGYSFEISTFREDGTYSDGRHPDHITVGTPYTDALRRDFTINGLFYDPINETVIDYVEGKEDIKKKQIRAIGNPDFRFQEDRLRMLRALRFALRLGFSIEPLTYQAIRNHAPSLRPAVSVERIWQELKKMTAYNPLLTFEMLLDTTLYSVIFPPPFPSANHCKTLLCWKYLSSPLIVLLQDLLKNSPLQEQLNTLEQFKISNEEKKILSQLYYWQHTPKSSPYHWALFLADPSFSFLVDSELLHLTPKAQKEHIAFINQQMIALQPHIERLRKKKFILTGPLLAAEGVFPGPEMKRLILEGERLAINHDIRDPQMVLRLLKDSPLWK